MLRLVVARRAARAARRCGACGACGAGVDSPLADASWQCLACAFLWVAGKPSAFFAMGSPLGCFLSLRGATLGRSFVLEHCPRVYNVFHPHDPVAYRLEPLLAETYGEGAEEGEESEEADQGGDARHSHNSEEGAEGDPWMVDENERARQAIDEEDDWSTDQQAMATPRAQ
eukprot:725437-Prymnesium_polylepis.4